MELRLYPNNFAEVFSELLEETGVTCYQISQYSHLDQAYLSRLKNGMKKNPSADTVLKIGFALTYHSKKVRLSHLTNLVKSAGYTFTISN